MLGAGFQSLLNSVLLHKCIQARWVETTASMATYALIFTFRLWENSKHVARQLDKIGTLLPKSLLEWSVCMSPPVRCDHQHHSGECQTHNI